MIMSMKLKYCSTEYLLQLLHLLPFSHHNHTIIQSTFYLSIIPNLAKLATYTQFGKLDD
jgi:hypothetical protein